MVQHASMSEVGVDEAETNFSQLLERVAAGEEIVILRAEEPVARLVPVEHPPEREFGRDRGQLEVPEDFDDPLPEEVVSAFRS